MTRSLLSGFAVVVCAAGILLPAKGRAANGWQVTRVSEEAWRLSGGAPRPQLPTTALQRNGTRAIDFDKRKVGPAFVSVGRGTVQVTVLTGGQGTAIGSNAVSGALGVSGRSHNSEGEDGTPGSALGRVCS